MTGDDRAELDRREAAEVRVWGFVQACDRLDLLLAALVSVVVWMLLTVMPWPILHPQAWGPVAVAAGLRSPASTEAGLWTFLAHRVFILAGPQGGLAALAQIGHVVGALLSGLAYLLMRSAFSAQLSVQAIELAPLTTVLRLVAIVGTVAFACSEAFWRLAQFFSDDLLCLFLGATAILAFERFRWHRGKGWYCLCYFLLGLLVVETPVGVALLVVFFGWNWWERRQYWARAQSLQVLVGEENDGKKRKGRAVVKFNEKTADDPIEFFDEELSDAVKRASIRLENGLFFLFFSLGLVGALVIGFRTFRVLGGLEAAGLDAWGYPVPFFLTWFKGALALVRPDQLFFASALSFFPFLVAYLVLPKATDQKDAFAVPMVILLSILGCAVWTQLGPVSRFWYWTWELTRSAPLPDTMRAVFAFLGAATLMAVFQMLLCVCRKRIEGVQAIAVEEGRGLAGVRLVGRILLAAIVAAIVVLSVWGRRQPSVCRKMELVRAYVKTFADQVKGLDCIFTDGVFDDAVRLAFKSRGEACPSLLSMTSGRDAYSAALRVSAAKDDEDVRVLKVGALETLRFWAAERKDRLARLAIQVGYEALVKCHVTNGRSAGLALRVGTPEDDAVFDRYDVAAEALGNRALALASETPSALGGFDAGVSEKFDFILWRLARMADLRVNRSLLKDDGAGVVRHRELAARLDGVNDPYRKLKKELEKLRPVESVVLSPQEGLALALKRADFNLAYRYATRVLKDDSDDLNANFAMGMWAAETRQYKIALMYLEAADSKRPNEPSILNNLAMVRYKLGDLLGAARDIKRARDLNPGSKEIQENVKRITEAGQAWIRAEK